MPRARARCRTDSLCTRRYGSKRSRPHGQPQQHRPQMLFHSRSGALEALDADIDATPAAGELASDAGRERGLLRSLTDAPRQQALARAKSERRAKFSDFETGRPAEGVVRIRQARHGPVVPRDGPREARLSARAPEQSAAVAHWQVVLGDRLPRDIGPKLRIGAGPSGHAQGLEQIE